MLKKKFQVELETMLVKQTGLNKLRSQFISQAIEGILSYGSVVHKKMALALPGEGVFKSYIRKIERFFADTSISINCFFLIQGRALKINQKVSIIIDRTNWDFGQKYINILVAAVVWNNFAIPVVWEVFDKKGGSSTAERKRLLKKLIAIIGLNNIEVVLADREFVGNEWLQFLHEEGIPFIIRIRNNLYVEFPSEARIQVNCLMEIVKRGETREIDVILSKIPMRLVGTRSKTGELVIVVASKSLTGQVLTHYRMRWLIELFFKSIKTKGFNLEETHMTCPERISKLFGILAIACLLVVKAGTLRALFKKIPIKNHGRALFSVFTYGLDFLRTIFSNHTKNEVPPPLSLAKIVQLLFYENWEFSFTSGSNNVGY